MSQESSFLSGAENLSMTAATVRIVAKVYVALLLLVGVWAWWIDVSMNKVATEHLLPDLTLGLLTLPSSLLISPLYNVNPGLFTAPYVQLGLLTVCAVVQGTLILWLASHLASRSAAASAA